MSAGIRDHLEQLTVEALRVMAARRGIAMRSPDSSRQELIRSLEYSLSHFQDTMQVVHSLNEAGLAAYRYLCTHGGRRGLPDFVRSEEVAEDLARTLFDELRQCGLVFPVGDWGQVAIPEMPSYWRDHIRRSVDRSLPARPRYAAPKPEVVPEVRLINRPGTLGQDVAEFLSRVSRRMVRVTQKLRVHQNDLKAMLPWLNIQDPDYADWIVALTGTMGLVSAGDGSTAALTPDAPESWLRLEEAVRLRLLTAAVFSGVMPPGGRIVSGGSGLVVCCDSQSRAMRALYRSLLSVPPGSGLRLSDLCRTVAWATPMAVARASNSAQVAAVRIGLRYLFWLGFAGHNSEADQVWGPGPWLEAAEPDAEELHGAWPVQEDRIVVQPDGTVFVPPNISPWTLFHVRRVTDETRKPRVGMHPVTARSIRRAMDLGIRASDILAFLGGFSRAPLPGTVRDVVETVSRQYGRIRLVPADYVLVTEDEVLMQELRRQGLVDRLMGRQIHPRVAAVPEMSAEQLLNTLRQRGYAPLDERRRTRPVPLPAEPSDRRDGHAVPTVLQPIFSQLDAELPVVAEEFGDLDELDDEMTAEQMAELAAVLDQMSESLVESDEPEQDVRWEPADILALLESVVRTPQRVRLRFRDGNEVDAAVDAVVDRRIHILPNGAEERRVVSLGQIRTARLVAG